MRTAALPPEDLPPLTRSVVACLAAILELESDEIPAPGREHPEPWTAWRVWLARRGLGLVPVAAPRDFGWPGPWIALLRRRGAGRARRAAPRGPGGAPP